MRKSKNKSRTEQLLLRQSLDRSPARAPLASLKHFFFFFFMLCLVKRVSGWRPSQTRQPGGQARLSCFRKTPERSLREPGQPRPQPAPTGHRLPMPRGRRVTALPLVDPGSSGEPRERETRLWKASPEFSSGRTHCAAGSSQQGAPGTLYPHGTCHVQAGGSGVRLGAHGPWPSASLCTRPPHSPEERPSRDDVTEALGPAKRCRSLQNHHTRACTQTPRWAPWAWEPHGRRDTPLPPSLA